MKNELNLIIVQISFIKYIQKH